jgi:tetratricopeptide (TPR) repeat protein
MKKAPGNEGEGFGTAEEYLNAAKSMRNMGEFDLALNVCDKGSGKFPSNGNIHILRAQILITKFKKVPKPEVLKAALASLEKAIKINPRSYLARILASQIFLKGRAYKRARAILLDVLKTMPEDEKAKALLAEAERYIPKPPKEEKPKAPDKAAPVKAAEAARDDVIVVADNISETVGEGVKSAEGGQWVLDEKLVIDASEDNADEVARMEVFADKLTMFGRLEGLQGIFIIDGAGQPYKVINKKGLDENAIPSLAFNLFKASVAGTSRTNFGSFQRGILVAPFGTVIIVNMFYATLALVVDNDANLQLVEARIQRYLEEAAG